MNRHTAGALIGWGSFLSVASFFAVGLVALRFGPLAGTAIGAVVGMFAGVGARHGADRRWPRGIADEPKAVGDLGDIDSVLEICRRDRERLPATWGDLRPVGPDVDTPFPAADLTMVLPSPDRYRGARRRAVQR